MKISFEQDAFNDFIDWSIVNKGIFNKIVSLIKEIKRTPFNGSGKPEALKYEFAGYWSRRITTEHRLVYKFDEDEVLIVSCKGHY
jgi:toxin YoeB